MANALLKDLFLVWGWRRLMVMVADSLPNGKEGVFFTDTALMDASGDDCFC